MTVGDMGIETVENMVTGTAADTRNGINVDDGSGSDA